MSPRGRVYKKQQFVARRDYNKASDIYECDKLSQLLALRLVSIDLMYRR